MKMQFNPPSPEAKDKLERVRVGKWEKFIFNLCLSSKWRKVYRFSRKKKRRGRGLVYLLKETPIVPI